MSRLIDADAEIKWVHEHVLDAKERFAITDFLREAATIDPVHAAGACYCRECRNYNKPRLGWCSHHMDRENPDDFCSYGQRREED